MQGQAHQQAGMAADNAYEDELQENRFKGYRSGSSASSSSAHINSSSSRICTCGTGLMQPAPIQAPP